jgi:hypothetical protein
VKRLVGWLITVHRYVGLVFCAIFVAWFASGLVMIYHRMPQYSAEERLARLAPLTVEDIAVDPSRALTNAGLAEYPQRAQLMTYGARPAYRFLSNRGWHTVFADDGSVLEPLDPEEARAAAGDAFPQHRATLRHAGTITEPDQWTIGSPFGLTGPLHKIALGDANGTELYVATTTGEIVMKTDASSRFWGYAGPVLHWFYFRPLRVQGALWSALIIYGSIVGCLLCLSGLVIGALRLSPRRRYRGGGAMSPYTGWLRWHHYAGLAFGLATFTFLFSGFLSMVPWSWSPGNAPDPQQVLAIRGGRVNIDRFGLPPTAALQQFQREFQPHEIEFRQFLGAPFYLAYVPPRDSSVVSAAPGYGTGASLRSLLVNGAGDVEQVGELFEAEELLEAARVVMPDAAPVDAAWLTAYDAYYYGRGGDRRLPVLRVRFDDADATWLYLDAHDGSVVQREIRRTRLERWIYHGLHSLDIPWVYQRGWAWYPLVVGLSLGGLALSLTSLIVGSRVLAALLRRASRPAPAPR